MMRRGEMMGEEERWRGDQRKDDEERRGEER